MAGDLAGVGVCPLREGRGGVVSIHLRTQTSASCSVKECGEGVDHMPLPGNPKPPLSGPHCHTVEARRHPGKASDGAAAAAAGIGCKVHAEYPADVTKRAVELL